MTDPKNPTKLAALGQYLLDEADVRGEYVDPGRNFIYYRVQPRALQAAEIEAARDCFQRALAANSLHVPAMMGMAQIKYRENLFGDAERYVRNALAVKGEDSAILDMMGRLMKIAAGQQMARALAAIASYTQVEPIGGGWERHTTYFGDPVAAERFASSSDGLIGQANAYTRRALAALKDTPESFDYLGTLAARHKDFENMVKNYEQAVRKVPDKLEYRYALANAYASLGNFESYLEQANAGRNFEQTSCGAHLLAAWQSILNSNWKRAEHFLTAAGRLDSGDSRIPAYLGAMAEGQGQLPEAAACFRAALAVEEANGLLRASSRAGTPLCSFDEVARAVALRIRLARVIEERDPAEALALYEKNLALEPRLTSPEMLALSSYVEGRNRSETEQLRMKNHPMLRQMIDALLPEPNRSSDEQKTPPNAAGLLQTSRSLAAFALYKLGRKQEAADYFRRVDSYANYARQRGVGSAYLRIVGIWTPRPIADIAAACLRETGGPTGAPGRGEGTTGNPFRRGQ